MNGNRITIHIIASWPLLIFAVSCGTPEHPPHLIEDIESVAIGICGSCHQYAPPTDLPTPIWEELLPHMGHRLGIYAGSKSPDSLFEAGLERKEAESLGIFPDHPQITKETWDQIYDWYLKKSSATIAPGTAERALPESSLFSAKPSGYTRRPPLTSMIKIVPASQTILFGDGKNNVNALIQLNNKLELDYQLYVKNTPVDYHIHKGEKFLLSVGKSIYPSDYRQGELEKISGPDQVSVPNKSQLLLDNLRRPVHITHSDVDKNGHDDLVICQFGNFRGHLSLFKNDGQTYAEEVLLDQPGAVKTISHDMNSDGWPDLIVLMSQGREGIYYLENMKGTFAAPREWLSFSPLAGSTYFDLLDWDEDGDLDILYTSGDNADKTSILKSYHGIYLFENQGDNNFTQAYFHPMHGAYQALAHDYDLDGDLDIAAISFFPDYSSPHPQHFVYLQQEDKLSFKSYSFPEANAGRWIQMDAADLDQDGDIDLALGSFVGFYPAGDTTNLFEKWVDEGPAVMYLENRTY